MKQPVPPLEHPALAMQPAPPGPFPPQSTKVARGGRPTKFSAEVQERIVQAITAGNYLETAAQSASVSYQTLNEWIKRGEAEPKGAFREFAEAVKKARAVAEARAVRVIRDAAPKTWQAAAWWLERSFPERWGRVSTAPGQAQVNIDLGKMLDTILERRATILDPRGPKPISAGRIDAQGEGAACALERNRTEPGDISPPSH